MKNVTFWHLFLRLSLRIGGNGRRLQITSSSVTVFSLIQPNEEGRDVQGSYTHFLRLCIFLLSIGALTKDTDTMFLNPAVLHYTFESFQFLSQCHCSCLKDDSRLQSINK